MSEATRSVFLPALLLAIAVSGWSGFQSTQLVLERGNLQRAIAEQDTQVEQSKKVRERLDSLASRTARLARSGNANATLIVEQLRQRGISIKSDEKPAAAQP